MINESTVEAIYPLVEKLTKKGIMVSPYPTTPLDKLVNICHVPNPRGIGEANVRTIEEKIMEASTCKDQNGAVKHDVVMEEMVEVISETIRYTHNLARNVVNPIVKEVVKDVEDHLQACESVKQTYVKVVPIFYRDIWNIPALPEMVERYSETPFMEVDLMVGVPFESSKDSLLELAKTGGSRFDKELEKFFESIGDELVASTFRACFAKEAIARSKRLSDVISTSCHDQALLVHLFARKLLQVPPEGIELGIEAFRKVMSEIVAQSGRVVYQAMGKRENNRRHNSLLASFPPGRDTIGSSTVLEIFVNGDVYNQWLKDGGSPEILLGSYVTEQERGYKKLLESKDYFIKEWQKQERVLSTTQRLNRFNNAVEGMEIAIAKQINLLEDEHRVVDKAVLHQRLKENLHLMYGKFYENLYVYARKMICTVMFPHTMSLQLLCAIDNVKSDYPEMDIREAALLATIEIVATWVAKLCKVDHVTVKE